MSVNAAVFYYENRWQLKNTKSSFLQPIPLGIFSENNAVKENEKRPKFGQMKWGEKDDDGWKN